ncbi:MAG: hypothetical protein ACI89X_004993 [Planctomycetota bacterium]|jgi:hypothetical protein
MWLNPLTISCVVAMLFLTARLFVLTTLVMRLKHFARSLLIAVLYLVAMVITYGVESRVGDPSSVLAKKGDQLDPAWFSSVWEAQQATSLFLMGVVFALSILAVQLLGVSLKLRHFVLMHEADLITRDQIWVHQATKPGDTEGIPVGSVPEPN